MKYLRKIVQSRSLNCSIVSLAMKSEKIASWQEGNDKPRQCVEKQRHYSADKGLYSQGNGLLNGHMWL